MMMFATRMATSMATRIATRLATRLATRMVTRMATSYALKSLTTTSFAQYAGILDVCDSKRRSRR